MRVAIELLEYQSGEFVEAELFDEVTVDHFIEAQREWRPVVLEAARHLAKSGSQPTLVPRHFHWDWTRKEADLRMLAITFCGLSCDGKLQGLMKLLTVGHTCRLQEQAGKPIVYVDYLESAPWNIKPLMMALGQLPQYSGIGTILLGAAVRKSQEEGFKGRVALHSLPTSEQFYLKACGMTAVGRDPGKQNLLWFEFTPDQADRFIIRGAA